MAIPVGKYTTKLPIEELQDVLARMKAVPPRDSANPLTPHDSAQQGAQMPSKFAETEFWAQLLLMASIVAGWVAEYLPTDVAAYVMTASTFGYSVYRQMSKGRAANALAQQQQSLIGDEAYGIRVDLEDVAGQAEQTDARVESLEKQLAGLRRDLAQRADGDHRDAGSGNPNLNGQVGGSVSESVAAPDGP